VPELDEQPRPPDREAVKPAGRVRLMPSAALVGVLEPEALLGEGDRLVDEVDAGGEGGGGEEASGALARAHGCTSIRAARSEEQGGVDWQLATAECGRATRFPMPVTWSLLPPSLQVRLT